MIVPDDKNWTWVLERPCEECGFDASTCDALAVPGLICENAAQWRQLGADGHIRAGRPDEQTWSTLEYACHVRDVYRRYDGRIALMLAQDDPLFPNWDQDATAAGDAYEAQDAVIVVEQLVLEATQLAQRLDRLSGPDWARPGRRSDGATFTVGTISRYMIHDTVHHVWDVARQHA